MVSTLLIWVYVAVLCFAYGWLWVELIAKTGYLQIKTQIPFEIILVIGSGVLSVLLGIFHLWLPISVTVHLVVLTGGLGIIWFFRNNLLLYRKNVKITSGYNRLYFGILIIFLFLILIHAAQPATNPDTGLYHAQTIKWFNTYRIVPGLGNLYGPLALNSHAHLVMSFFNLGFITNHVFNQTWGSFVFLVYSSYAIRQSLNFLKTRPAFVIYYAGSLFWGFVFFRDWISSPTPDTVVMFFFFFLFGVLLNTHKSRSPDWQFAFLFFLLFVLITFKLSAIYGGMLGLSWLILRKEQVNGQVIRLVFFQALIVLTPYIIRNLILTGHLLYPIPALDLFDLDWEVPEAWLKIYQEGITAYSRVPTANWSDYINKPFTNWFSVWWVNQDRPGKIFFKILIALMPIISWQVITDIRRKANIKLITLWLSALVASLAWFISAPALRFGYGYLVPTLLLGVLLLIQNRISLTIGISVMMLMGIYGLNGIYKQFSRSTFSFVWPAGYPVPESEIRQIGNIKMRVALGFGRCYDLMPCTVPDPHPGLEMRGKKMEDGFRTVISKNKE